jgi:hypothetical protein
MKYFICLSFVFLLSSSFTSVDPNELKVEVCHNGKTISVSILALPVHVAHGDELGACSTSYLRPDGDLDRDGVKNQFDACPTVPGCPESGCPVEEGTCE